MELMKWEDKKVATVVIEKKVELTEREINYIVSGAIEGGIGYWACLDNTTKAWEGRNKETTFLTDYATKIILDGGELVFEVEDMEQETYTINLEKLLNGFKLNAENRPWDSELDNADVTTYDCIFQYAMFGQVVFG